VTSPDRTPRWLTELQSTLLTAAALVARGREAYDSDVALSLAFEALCTRVGDLAKKLVEADPARFSEPMWSLAARNRDFVVHHYSRIDRDLLWNTVANDLPRLQSLTRAVLSSGRS
jgi:uncharacterized protein with HEPN domain